MLLKRWRNYCPFWLVSTSPLSCLTYLATQAFSILNSLFPRTGSLSVPTAVGAMPFSLSLTPRYTVSRACFNRTPLTSTLHLVYSLLNTLVVDLLQFIARPCPFIASYNLSMFSVKSFSVCAITTVSSANYKICMRQLSSITSPSKLHHSLLHYSVQEDIN